MRVVQAAHTHFMHHISPLQDDTPEIEELNSLTEQYYLHRNILKATYSEIVTVEQSVADISSRLTLLADKNKQLIARELVPSIHAHLVTNLNNHVRLHTGERPFVCEEPGCDKAFAQVTNLNQHRKRHLSGRADHSYECSVCGEQFAQRNHMTNHRRSCAICELTFPNERLLQMHAAQHAPGEVEIVDTESKYPEGSCAICELTFPNERLLQEVKEDSDPPLSPPSPLSPASPATDVSSFHRTSRSSPIEVPSSSDEEGEEAILGC
ncbi:Uncharacterized protein OBRU01_19147 [Operophtera brumata]|uniref:C2H2-type domain-containing protein n=1 Tax=Operophtera brumata TaxID=104452 RepID=A0A0L7KX83_OPEBR|nr:Uncharacterized protein OBRU01_19147 [Operophtera brumata]